MKKAKQAIAIIGIIVLIGMYGFTLVAAVTDDPNTGHLLAGSVGCTILVPVIIWCALMIFSRYDHKDDDPDSNL